MSNKTNYLLLGLNIICLLLLLSIVILLGAYWFKFFDTDQAFSNISASLGALIVAISARNANTSWDRFLLILGLGVSFGFQFAAFYV